MPRDFRYYQTEADNAIYMELLINPKCLVKMFCGTGKSILMRRCKIVQNKKLVVYVFPSLSLITQFYNDYLIEDTPHPPEDILCISSENESTTNPAEIVRFLSRPSNCIICITYQSFKTLIDNLGNNRIDVCIFDEAHHAVGETYQKLIFENDVCEKQIFFTATPKNANGIIMYDRENLEAGMCGKLVYDYSYLQGVNEGYLNPFKIRIDMFTENTNKSVYESIARAVLSSGNSRVLTFHSDVNTERETSVRKFVNDREFKRVFSQIQKTEFPQIKKYKNKNVSMIALDASINGTNRREILKQFDKTPDDHVFVISSCETIGEGIDTKNANMCVFVDPKSSYVKIIQNIGRIVRKQFGVEKPNSTILIPCWVDKTKYLECGGDREKCDEVIRQDMSADGNFNGILNVMSALKQEDEDLYDICLYYPDTFSPQEIKSHLEKNGFCVGDVVGDGGLLETMEHVLDIELDYEDYEYCDTTEEMIMNIAEENDVCIEIHTNSLENPVERYNAECESGEIVRLYKCANEYPDENDDEDVYCPVLAKMGEKRTRERVDGPKRENRMRVNVHTNPDIKVLWNITGDFDITKEICSCVIDCEVVDNWYENFKAVKMFIDEHNKRPSSKSSTNDCEKRIGSWVSIQKQNYKNKQKSMKNKNKYDLWTAFLEEYAEYFKNDDEIWYENFKKLNEFINKTQEKPSILSSVKNEKVLRKWLDHQITNYTKKTGPMEDPVKYDLWTAFLEEYKDYFISNDAIWIDTLNELKTFIDTNKKRPNQHSLINLEKKLGGWLSQQINKFRKIIGRMRDGKRYELWANFVEEYAEYFISNDDIWIINLNELKTFIDTNKKRPLSKSLNSTEKKLGGWIRTQLNNLPHFQTDTPRHKLLSQFLEEYAEYFINDDDIWVINLNELKTFIDANKKRPNQRSDITRESQLGKWIIQTNLQYTKKILSNNRNELWSQFLEEYAEYFISKDEIWINNFRKLKAFIREHKIKPSILSSNQNEKVLRKWLDHQITNYNKKTGPMKEQYKYNLWTEFLEEYKEYMKHIQKKDASESTELATITTTPQPKNKSMKLKHQSTTTIPKETPEQKCQRTESELSLLNKQYKRLNSQNLHAEFNATPELWHQYHAIAETNEQTFPEDEIPRNRIIQQLNQIKTKRSKCVVDMGCGKAHIAQHFANDSRFVFKNYDHISMNNSVVSCDIARTPEEDDSVEICILSLAMWGSNCEDYIKEAHRILESNGQLFIIEPTKRWSTKDEHQNIIPGKEGSRMKELLEENGFVIKDQTIEKFCMFVCNKK